MSAPRKYVSRRRIEDRRVREALVRGDVAADDQRPAVRELDVAARRRGSARTGPTNVAGRRIPQAARSSGRRRSRRARRPRRSASGTCGRRRSATRRGAPVTVDVGRVARGGARAAELDERGEHREHREHAALPRGNPSPESIGVWPQFSAWSVHPAPRAGLSLSRWSSRDKGRKFRPAYPCVGVRGNPRAGVPSAPSRSPSAGRHALRRRAPRPTRPSARRRAPAGTR